MAFVGLRDHRPGALETVALGERAEGEDRLAAVVAPVHPRAFHPLGRERLARGLGDARADWQPFRRPFRVAHPVLVAAEKRKLRRDLRATRMAGAQVDESTDHLCGPASVVAQHVPELLELRLAAWIALAVGGREGRVEMLRDVVE